MTAPIPFDTTLGFVGQCAADGQTTHVASVALDGGTVAFLSLVGAETSVNAAFGTILKQHGAGVGFLPTEAAMRACAPDWAATVLKRDTDLSYWMWHTALRGTKAQHGILLPHNLSLPWGQQHPPVVPATTPPQPSEPNATSSSASPAAPDPEPVFAPRYLVAGLSERIPPHHRFFGHLRGLRVVLPPTVVWTTYLWERGLETGLLTPLPALGVRCWKLHGDPRRWNALSSEGVRSGHLTATPPTDDDKRTLGLLA